MSILLDALRKSENSQKPVEPPNIHSHDMPMEERKSINVGLLAIMLIVALLAIGWLVWRQYQPETDVYQPPVDLPAGRPAAVVPVTPVQQQAQAKPTPAQTNPDGTSRPRTPVESYQPSAQEIANAEQQRLTEAAVERHAKETAEAKARASSRQTSSPPVAKLPNSGKASPIPEGDEGKANPASQAAAKTPAKNQAARRAARAKQKESYQSPEPQPIGYWELPDDIRGSVPEIKFSVLVFSEQPKDRFVLINGERYEQGDELNPGLVLEEIRRDGVILSYRLYRFFVER